MAALFVRGGLRLVASCDLCGCCIQVLAMASDQGSSHQSEIAQAALAVVEHLSAQGIIEIPESVVGSPERKTARTAHHELSPGSADSETGFQTRSVLVRQVLANYFIPAPPLLQNQPQQQHQPQEKTILLLQMRDMMGQLLDETLNQQNIDLSAAFNASIEDVRAEIVAERGARVFAISSIETRLS